MYSESLDLHAASPLYQCSSLVDLDRYLLVLVYTDVRGHPGVSVSCVAGAFFGLQLVKRFSAIVSGLEPKVGALP